MRIDPQALFAGDPQIVQMMRAAIVENIESFSLDTATRANVLDDVLRVTDAVPYSGDAQSYIDVLIPLLTSASESAMAPVIAGLKAEGLAIQQRIETLDRDYKKFMREFEEFRRLETSPTIH